MKIITPLLCMLSLVLTHSVVNAEGLYKWKDARGVTQYGDRPPANSNAQPINLPKITVVEKYAEQWKPLKFDDPNTQQQDEQSVVEKPSGNYSKLAFLAPKANQAIRANDGDVSAMISLKPPLKKGHSIIFSIDGKASAKGKSRTQNFSGLGRGNHSIGVKVVDKKGKTLKSSSVSFNVLRFSKLNEKNIKQSSKIKPTNQVQQQQVSGSR